jgi:multicomponent K+:H+ antiporter subunit E
MIKNNTSTWRQRLFPHPLMSVILMLSWLILMHSLAVVHLISAILLGIILPKITQFFIQPAEEKINWLAAIRLFFVVLYDIIIADFQVGRLILGARRQIHPKWIRVPLDTNHPKINTLLALIVTTTPGTVSAGLDDDRGDLLVHALDALDEQAVITEIKVRYELALIRIFNINIQEHQHD